MARSHWIVVASWVGILSGAAVACGDSVTGSDIPENDAGTTGKDGGTSSGDGGTTIKPNDSGTTVTDTGTGNPDTGVKTDGGLPTVSTNVLDFGETDCGTTATAKTFTISNPSSSAVSFSSELVKAGASPFTLAPASGSVPPGGSVEVTVTPKAVVVPSSTTANAIGDTLKLTIGPSSEVIDLKQTAHGASLKILTNSGTDFGNVSTTAGAVSLPLSVANAGNQTAPITLSIVPDPSLDGGTSAFSVVAPAGPATPGLTPTTVGFAPTAVQDYAGTVHLEVGAGVALCDVAPADIAFKGKGTNGVVAVTPLAVTFGNGGLVDCGTTSINQVVKITNSSNTSITFSGTLTRGTTVFTLTYNATSNVGAISNQTIAANTSVNLTIVPKLIPQTSVTTPDAFGDTLTITTTASGDTDPHIIPIHQTAHGAIVTRTTNSIALGTVALGVTATSTTYSFANVGNADITLDQTIQGGAGSPFKITTASLPLTAAAAPTDSKASFTPVSVGASNDNAILSQPAAVTPVVLCSPLPGALALSGTGAAATAVAAPSPLSFGSVQCGAAAPLPKIIKLTNNGPATTFTTNLQKGAGSGFTVSPSVETPIAAGATVDVTVTAKAIPSGTVTSTPTGANGITDILELLTGNIVSPVLVTINETAQGAVIDFNGATTKAFGNQQKGGTTAPSPTNVRNTGNLSADLTFTTSQTTGPAAYNAFGPTTPTTGTIGGGTSVNNTLTFSPQGPVAAGNVAYVGAYTVTLTNPVAICGPLPSLVLTGTGTP